MSNRTKECIRAKYTKTFTRVPRITPDCNQPPWVCNDTQGV
nr:MAG TPA: hypothetical protein [Caudoviricetes sp.]